MRGFGVVEFLIVLAVIAAVLALLLTLLPLDHLVDPRTVECLNRVRNLAGIAVVAQSNTPNTPNTPKDGKQAGAFLREMLRSGLVEGEQNWELLRCPAEQSGAKVSYVSRDLDDKACAAASKPFIVIADDSLDHHETGLIVGYSDGAAKFREYPPDTVVGRESKVAELRCLRKD